MFGISKRTMFQLVKEFWIPFVLATGWTIYVVWGQKFSVQSTLENFGPAFFLTSWMTGQFFRVRKQAGVEASLGSVEQRLNHLVNELETKSQKMISHMTGGDSYLYFLPLHILDGKVTWVAFHHGEFPLHQPTVKIVDVEHLKGSFKPDSPRECITTHHLRDFYRGSTQTIGNSEVGNRSQYSFDISTDARNGKFLQETQFETVEGTVRTAWRITGPSGVVREQVHPDFPVNAEGCVVWNRPRVNTTVGLSVIDQLLPSSAH